MRSNAALLAVALLLAGGGARAVDSSATPASECVPQEGERPGICGFPADVRDFVDMRDACDHWRGEPVPEHEDDPQEDRKKQILEAIKESCTGTDKRLAGLKAAYVGDPKILQLLDEYEPDIESDD